MQVRPIALFFSQNSYNLMYVNSTERVPQQIKIYLIITIVIYNGIMVIKVEITKEYLYT